jgi:hypothetical protein
MTNARDDERRSTRVAHVVDAGDHAPRGVTPTKSEVGGGARENMLDGYTQTSYVLLILLLQVLTSSVHNV